MSSNGHAVLGPSSSKRWMTCTASVGLIEKEGRHETNAAAEEGTAAHTVLEFELLKRLSELGYQFDAGRLAAIAKEVEELGTDGEV